MSDATDLALTEALEGELITEVIVTYDRYKSRYTEECDSIQEAVRFIRYGEEYGTLHPVSIEFGDRKIDNDEDSEAFHKFLDFIDGGENY